MERTAEKYLAPNVATPLILNSVLNQPHVPCFGWQRRLLPVQTLTASIPVQSTAFFTASVKSALLIKNCLSRWQLQAPLIHTNNASYLFQN